MHLDIPELRGDNYKIWKERILLHLGYMDIDYAIRKSEPPEVTEESTPTEVALYERWEKSNRLSVMFIKTKITAGIRGSVEQYDKVQDLLKAIGEQFVTSNKALASTLIMKFSSIRITSVRGVREHIVQMRDIAAQLKKLGIDMSDSFLVHFILNTLPHQYGPFKISYNTHKDKWSINELMTMCVQEEERLVMELGESAMLATTFGKKKMNDTSQTYTSKSNQKGKGRIPPQADIKKEIKCFFCKRKGHVKKDCPKLKKWLEKKGNISSFVCYESNMVNVNINTWWIDSGSTIHIANSLQGMQNLRKPVGNELSILSGNKMGSPVEAIGTCTLTLDNGFVLVLERTFYVPSFSRNLISVSRLVPLGFSFTFQDNVFNLFYKSNNIGTGILADGLYRICLQNEATNNSLHVHIGTKRCNINEDSSMLWHRRLGHISIDRIKRLVKDGVLSTLDYTDFETCVDCIKGKQTNKSKKHANRSSNILEIIHTDICCPDMDMPGQKYFITFIDDYSRYMYVYLLHNKYEALDAFKIFKAEVENQCGKQIHIVRSDRGGEYYGRYTENGQAPGPFAKFLQEHGIVAQHTMPGSPDQNGVAERRNRTLVDMVRTKTSKGYRFYCPSHSTRIVESRNAKFLENDMISGRDRFRDLIPVHDHIETQPSTSYERLVIVHHTPQVPISVEQPIIEVPQIAENLPEDQQVQELPYNLEQTVEPQAPPGADGPTLRRSTRGRKSAIPSDYIVYLQETDIGVENDPETFSQAISCNESELWYNAMKDELDSMKSNEVWDLVELPKGVQAIGCKWVYKTKRDSLGNIERYKARLVAKGFTQKE